MLNNIFTACAYVPITYYIAFETIEKMLVLELEHGETYMCVYVHVFFINNVNLINASHVRFDYFMVCGVE